MDVLFATAAVMGGMNSMEVILRVAVGAAVVVLEVVFILKAMSLTRLVSSVTDMLSELNTLTDTMGNELVIDIEGSDVGDGEAYKKCLLGA